MPVIGLHKTSQLEKMYFSQKLQKLNYGEIGRTYCGAT